VATIERFYLIPDPSLQAEPLRSLMAEYFRIVGDAFSSDAEVREPAYMALPSQEKELLARLGQASTGCMDLSEEESDALTVALKSLAARDKSIAEILAHPIVPSANLGHYRGACQLAKAPIGLIEFLSSGVRTNASIVRLVLAEGNGTDSPRCGSLK
jgi:hypothetical protein